MTETIAGATIVGFNPIVLRGADGADGTPGTPGAPGADGVSTTAARIDPTSQHLLITLSNGTVLDAGDVATIVNNAGVTYSQMTDYVAGAVSTEVAAQVNTAVTAALGPAIASALGTALVPYVKWDGTNLTTSTGTIISISGSGGLTQVGLTAEVGIFGDGTANTVTITTVAAQTNVTGDTIALQLTATSSGGEGVDFTVTGLPPGVSFTDVSGYIFGFPTTAGVYHPVITATDDTGASSTSGFTWTITNTIAVTNPGAQTATQGTAVNVHITATDTSSTATLAYASSGLPAGLAVDTSGNITGVPTGTQSATNCTITVTDGSGATASTTFTWTVAAASANTVTVTDPGKQTDAQGNIVSLQMVATTSGGTASIVGFAATGLPTGLSINGTTGLISGPANVAGTYTVTVTATDSTGVSGSDTFTWVISGGGGTLTGTPTLITRGSAALGSSLYPVPTTGAVYYVSPSGSDSANGTSTSTPVATLGKAILLASTAGGTIVLRAGTYHESVQTATSAKPITIQNYPGEVVWLEGAVTTGSWTNNGDGTWTHSGIPYKFYRQSASVGWRNTTSVTAVLTTDAAADLSDQVFLINGSGVVTMLTQLADSTTPAAGQFSVDYTANTITIGTDPTGSTVKVSDKRYAIIANTIVNIQGIGIRFYAPDYWTSGGTNDFVNAPVIYGGTSSSSSFSNCQVMYSASTGMSVRVAGITTQSCTFQFINYVGIGGNTCNGIAIRDTTFDNVNTGKYAAAPNTAAVKITRSIAPLIWNCRSSNAHTANGFWYDVNVVGFVTAHSATDNTHNKGFHVEESNGGFLNGTQSRGTFVGCIDEGSHYGVAIFASGFIDVWCCKMGADTTQLLDVEQDTGRLSHDGYLTTTQCSWVVNSVDVANCILGSGGTPIRFVWSATDNTPVQSADTMNCTFRNNYLNLTGNVVIQWGDGASAGHYTNYATSAGGGSYADLPTALAAAQAAHTTIVGNSLSAITDANSLAMTASVAAAAGVLSGTKKAGPWITA